MIMFIVFFSIFDAVVAVMSLIIILFAVTRKRLKIATTQNGIVHAVLKYMHLKVYSLCLHGPVGDNREPTIVQNSAYDSWSKRETEEISLAESHEYEYISAYPSREKSVYDSPLGMRREAAIELRENNAYMIHN